MINTENRENLELAAKAAEIVVLGYVEYYDDFYWNGPSWGLIVEGANGVWNPLVDDGDALRLAAKLGIDVEWRSDGRVAAYRHTNANGYCFTALVSFQEDRAPSVRRAIVRAAADIAKSDQIES